MERVSYNIFKFYYNIQPTRFSQNEFPFGYGLNIKYIITCTRLMRAECLGNSDGSEIKDLQRPSDVTRNE